MTHRSTRIALAVFRVALVASVISAAGCGSSAYGNLANVIRMPTQPMTTAQSARVRQYSVRLSRAATCAGRADELASQASVHRGVDTALLVLAAVTGVAGVVLSSVAVAFDDTADAARRTFLAVGAGLSGGSAGVFGLRAALDLSDLGRRERAAAAKMAGLALDAAYVSSDADQMRAAFDAAQDCTSADVDAVGASDEDAVARLVQRLSVDATEEVGVGGNASGTDVTNPADDADTDMGESNVGDDNP